VVPGSQANSEGQLGGSSHHQKRFFLMKRGKGGSKKRGERLGGGLAAPYWRSTAFLKESQFGVSNGIRPRCWEGREGKTVRGERKSIEPCPWKRGERQ